MTFNPRGARRVGVLAALLVTVMTTIARAKLPDIVDRAQDLTASSPYRFVTTGNEHLRIVSNNSLAGMTVELHGRFFDPDGSVKPFRYVHTPNTDRSSKQEDFPLGPGVLSNLVVVQGTGSPVYGQTFVRVDLIQGLGGATFTLGTLLQGYVAGNQARAWPGSPLESSLDGGGYVRTIAGTVPGVGVAINEVVPANARWELVSMFAYLNCDGNVFDRVMYLEIATPFFQPLEVILASQPVTASQTGVMNFYQGGPYASRAVATQMNAYSSLPRSAPLLAGYHILVDLLTGYAAGDYWTNCVYCVREWLVP